jgi:NAD(P)-dependent dehydrogenase (short-subunit alcohol dehydrogenase family)
VTRLTGKLAVVTGASRGIGLAAAQALAGAGATVVRLARSLDPGVQGQFRDLRCDLARSDEIGEACSRILREWGPPAIVVQNAGAFLLAPFEATDPTELDLLLTLNLRAPFILAQGLLPAMRAVGEGSHITIGSVSDHVAYPENSAYTATKHGLRGLHLALAAEYRGTGVRFTLVSPGATDTPIWDRFDPDQHPGLPRRALMLRPEDVADAVLFAATRPAHATVEWLRLSSNFVTSET